MLQLLLNAEVYDPQPLGQQHLLVAVGKILWLGDEVPVLDKKLPVSVVDLEGRRLIPGLIDGHAHLTGGGGESGFASRVPALGLSRFTQAGITTVVGVLGTDDTTRNTASLLAQTRGLCEQGLNAYCHTGGYHLPPITVTGSVRSDIVHIDRIIGVGEVAISDHRSSQPTLNELLRLASEAHVAGLITGKAGIIHLHLGDGERGLDLVRQALDHSELPPRTFNPTHINRRKALFDEALELAERGCTVDLTAFPEPHSDDEWSAEQGLLRYFEAGLPTENITVSSDGGGCLPVFDHQGEMLHQDVGRPESLTQVLTHLLSQGQPPEQVVPAFTSNVARLLRLSTKGRLAPGMDADLVVLGESYAVRDVMINGCWHKQAGKTVIRGSFEGGEL